MRKKDIYSQRSIFFSKNPLSYESKLSNWTKVFKVQNQEKLQNRIKKVNSLIIFTSTRLHFYAIIGNNYLREVTPVHLATLSRGSPVSW